MATSKVLFLYNKSSSSFTGQRKGLRKGQGGAGAKGFLSLRREILFQKNR
jgi:hypothetical protein